MHPSAVLFQGKHPPVSIPVCDHYAGSEKLMRRSMLLQRELGPVFDITFDCEDGASAGNEAAHAALVGELIAGEDNLHGRIGARVHDVDSPYFEQDVSLICRAAAQRLAFLVLPKVNGLADVERGIATINLHAKEAGRADLPVHVLIETHGALEQVHAIAALPQVECLSFGVMDFVSAHNGAIPAAAMRSPGQFTHPLVVRAKLEISAACHAHGKVPSHNVCTEIKDTTVAAADAQRAAEEFGYTRMWSIHPAQITSIIRAMSPGDADVTEAGEILSRAQAADWGPIQFNGTLHDRASYRYYWTILQRAQRSWLPLPPPIVDFL
jgi:citrate lyase subunit beta/citryl-CoA lyase